MLCGRMKRGKIRSYTNSFSLFLSRPTQSPPICLLLPINPLCPVCPPVLHVALKTMRLRMRKASQQSSPAHAPRPSRTKRRHSEVEECTPTGGGRGLLSTIKKLIRGNAVKVSCLRYLSPKWHPISYIVHYFGPGASATKGNRAPFWTQAQTVGRLLWIKATPRQ